MKQTVRLAGGINELFGTLDENIKLFESTLHVTTHLQDHDLEIEGAPAQVERAAQILVRIQQSHSRRPRPGQPGSKISPPHRYCRTIVRTARRFFAHSHSLFWQEKHRAEKSEPAPLH